MTAYLENLIADEAPALVYIMDPMCSWCWAFKPVLAEIRARFPELGFYTLPGGLAPDSDQPMPEEQQEKIAGIWRTIEAQTGTPFNHSFWTECQPRRSTYPSCRGLLLARDQGLEDEMIAAIQSAYYLEARNPSDLDTLADCAEAIGLERASFSDAMAGDSLDLRLQQEISAVRQMGVQSFPTLALKVGGQWYGLALDYRNAAFMIEQIEQKLA